MPISPYSPGVLISYLSIIIITIISQCIRVPVLIQLLVISLSCIYIGSYASIYIGTLISIREEGIQVPEQIQTKDALMLPIYGSVILLGLYIIVKLIDKSLLNPLLIGYFSFLGIICIQNILEYNLEQLLVVSQQWKKQILFRKQYNINIYIYKKNDINICISKLNILTYTLSFIPVLLYIYTGGHWITNNILGIAFTINGIQAMVIPNFKTGFLILWLLFLYDIFWVYTTNVMVSVAKSIDIPIKLLFPLDHNTNKFSILGLGDLVVPAILISLCLKFDFDQFLAQHHYARNNHVKTQYFNYSLIGYAIGILITYSVMNYFNKPQPALLFLVPCVSAAILIIATKNKELKTLFNYDEAKNIKSKI